MRLENNLYQKSYLYFIGFFAMVIVGFWFTYFTRILDQENYRLHTHGLALILWCLMLITQAYLIRAKKYHLHKGIGKASYVLVPIVIITTLDLLKFRMTGISIPGPMDLFFLALVLNALVVFAVLYGLAIWHRKTPVVHARYMVCTIFPMITPATDRIIGFHFRSILPWLYTIDGHPIAPVVGFILGDLLMLGLCIWDWKSHRRINVFPVALLMLIMYHYSVLQFYKFAFWQEFGKWFVNL